MWLAAMPLPVITSAHKDCASRGGLCCWVCVSVLRGGDTTYENSTTTLRGHVPLFARVCMCVCVNVRSVLRVVWSGGDEEMLQFHLSHTSSAADLVFWPSCGLSFYRAFW